MNKSSWSADSWRTKTLSQLPHYTDQKALSEVETQLEEYPPLVFASETNKLKAHLSDVAEGKAFLLQGGDCAESFDEFNADKIQDTFRLLLQMAIVLTYGAACPVIKVGRMAGQYAKPRSSATETRGDLELPSYRGDIINSLEFSQAARNPDPERILKAYGQASATLNYLRALSQGGYADLHKVQEWNLGFVERTPQSERYGEMAAELTETLKFMSACGLNAESIPQLSETEFYVSHEALLLPYEQSLTRFDTISQQWVDCSAHMLWLGDRTRQLSGAHVEFLRGVSNPIGIKCGPTLAVDELLQLLEILNPDNESGKITLISRMGADKAQEKLPRLVRAVQSSGYAVVWSCDPMHGNTFSTTNGYKTRRFDKILEEVETFFTAHQAEGTYAGGIHLEMTGKHVTECVGGSYDVTEETLAHCYETACDPRLNASQSLELAFLLADRLKGMRQKISAADC